MTHSQKLDIGIHARLSCGAARPSVNFPGSGRHSIEEMYEALEGTSAVWFDDRDMVRRQLPVRFGAGGDHKRISARSCDRQQRSGNLRGLGGADVVRARWKPD